MIVSSMTSVQNKKWLRWARYSLSRTHWSLENLDEFQVKIVKQTKVRNTWNEIASRDVWRECWLWGLGQENSCYSFRHWSDHWRGPDRGSQLDDGCWVARHSWCVCVLFSFNTCQMEMYVWQENQRLHGSQAACLWEACETGPSTTQTWSGRRGFSHGSRSAGAADDVKHTEFV